MKKEYKFLLAVFLIFLGIIILYHYLITLFFNSYEFISFFIFIFLISISFFLLGSLNKGKALELSHLNKGEEIEILKNYHPANYKLGDKRNISYYIIKRGTDKKIYLFTGPENYHHLPYNKFIFIWNGKKLIPQKN